MRDLVILVADKNMEFAMQGILARDQSLAIQKIAYNIYVHSERDPGCLRKAHDFLRLFQGSHHHALVMFDRKGCGRGHQTREELEAEVEKNLSVSGWGERAACIVFDPELENWVWSNSPHVATVLGWKGPPTQLRIWLANKGQWRTGKSKPEKPKEAVEHVLRTVGKPRSSALYRELAESVSLERCTDSAFKKLKDLLSRWFPQRNLDG